MRLLAAVWLGLFSLSALGQSFPEKPMRFIVPYPPGGPSDHLARLIGHHIGERWGQKVIVENRAGASGIVGAAAGAKAPADGYTLTIAPVGILVVNPYVYPSLPYDAVRDFAPVTQITTSPFLLAVSKSAPARTIKELIAYAKANPGKLTIGNSGVGTGQHLSVVHFAMTTGIDVTHVSYKGSGPATTDLLGGVVAALFDMQPLIPHVKAGKVQALAVTSKNRLSILPDVPTMGEATGRPDYEFEAWQGLVAPAGTPAPILAKYQQEIASILRVREISEALVNQGLRPVGNTPAQFAEIIKSDLVRYKQLVQLGDVKPQ